MGIAVAIRVQGAAEMRVTYGQTIPKATVLDLPPDWPFCQLSNMPRRTLLRLLAVGGLAAIAPMARAAPANRKATVLASAFMSLPSSIVDYPLDERSRLLDPGNGRLIADDAANGYLAVSGDGANPGFILALFRRAAAGPVIAVQRYDEATSHTAFLFKDERRWEDRSRELVPGYSPDAAYELPRTGATVLVKNANGQIIEKLRMHGLRFAHI